MKTSEISYCCSTSESFELTKKIKAWISKREEEGFKVEFMVKENDGMPVVMWQCVKCPDGWREFTPCIGMDGREFLMN